MEKTLSLTFPNDIKLELNAGTLTLKAGSKVYVPNGSGVFDAVTIESDKTISTGWGEINEKQYLFVQPDYNLRAYKEQYTYSGTTAPTVFQSGQYAIWFDTTNNSIKWTNDGGVTWTGGYSLPIAIVEETTNSGVIDKIDQVFNGKGYIGTTDFVTPNVKGYVPDGLSVENEPIYTEYETIKVLTAQKKNDNIMLAGDNGVYRSIYYADSKEVYEPAANVFFDNGKKISGTPLWRDSITLNPSNIGAPYVISQYANSPKFMSLLSGLSNIFSNAKTLEDWYNIVFNLKTAQGFGLDIWGAILNQSRMLKYINPKLIDVSLKNEQIVVRSGSVLWIPNGSNYKSVVLPRDYVSDVSLSGTNKYVAFYGNNDIVFYDEDDVYSGSQPTPSGTDAIWYDTTNNVVKITSNSGSTWTTVQYSLPIARISTVDDVITTIDNIYNGFGYFGSTIFVLPGVSGFTPNGLTADGQNLNEYFEITEVVLYNITQALSSSQYVYYNSTTGNLALVKNYYESTIEPSSFPCLWWDTANNLMKYKAQQSDAWSVVPASAFAQIYGDGTSTRPSNINVLDLYLQKSETVYLQGAQVIDGVAYTNEQIEDLYRMTLFLKAMSNITNATLKNMNSMFAQYFNGQCFAYEYDTMKIRIVVRFFTTKIEKAILTNLLPKPTGVLLGMEFLQAQEYFGFNVSGLPADEQPYAPADQKPFYW